MRRQAETQQFSRRSTNLLFIVAAVLMAFSRSRVQAAGPAAAAPGSAAAAGSPVRRIVVSIPDRKLVLLEDGRVVKIYRVAIGASASPTPSGQFKIVHRVPHPAYYAPGVVLPPGPENPLGTHWIGLDLKHFGIHGTNQPRSIGRKASHGCIRMRNEDVAELFARVHAGDTVELLAERTEETVQLFGGDRPAVLSAQAAPAVETLQAAPAASAAQQ